MAEILLFHHVQGQTEGFLDFAAEMRSAGHTVHAPDLFEGNVFRTLEEGMGFVESLGLAEIVQRSEGAAAELPSGVVYAGFSLGVLPAQKLTQRRPGAVGALFFHSCLPVSEFGGVWPKRVPVQVHAMEADPFFVGDGDIDAARQLVESADNAELFLYPGDQHLFADSSLSSYDAGAAALMTTRVLDFLATRSPGPGADEVDPEAEGGP